MTFNGWKNRETWNVAMWLNNTESYYFAVLEFMKDYKQKKINFDYNKQYN